MNYTNFLKINRLTYRILKNNKLAQIPENEFLKQTHLSSFRHLVILSKHKHMRTGVTGVVLAGGRSSRFGRDKGLYPYRGKPLVMHAADIIRPLCDDLLIISNKPHQYAAFGLPVMADLFPGCGPLAGIHSGLSNAGQDTVIFIACDIPNIPSKIFSFLLSNLGDHDAIMPTHGKFIETLCAVYHKKSLPAIALALEEKRYKILDAHASLHVHYIPVEHKDFYAPDIFRNINYPQDL